MKTFFIITVSCYCFCCDVRSQEKLYSNEFSLSEVTLLESPFKHARGLNIQALLKYNVDLLLAPYRKEAGLKPKDSSYTNWKGLDGHIGGHYLTVMAINAATGNAECKKRMLYNCQIKNMPGSIMQQKNWAVMLMLMVQS
jgi:uncharacterized protein